MGLVDMALRTTDPTALIEVFLHAAMMVLYVP